MALDLCELQAELNVLNTELFLKNQTLRDFAHENERLSNLVTFQGKLLAQGGRPLHTIIAERVSRNLQMAAFMACGLAGLAVGQVKRVKFPRLRVDWQ